MEYISHISNKTNKDEINIRNLNVLNTNLKYGKLKYELTGTEPIFYVPVNGINDIIYFINNKNTQFNYSFDSIKDDLLKIIAWYSEKKFVQEIDPMNMPETDKSMLLQIKDICADVNKKNKNIIIDSNLFAACGLDDICTAYTESVLFSNMYTNKRGFITAWENIHGKTTQAY